MCLAIHNFYLAKTCISASMGNAGEVFVYIPYLDETTTPFRVPEVGDPIISGIRWLSKTAPVKKATVNGCRFDALLVDLKVQTLAQKVCLSCLFTHSSGPASYILCKLKHFAEALPSN